LTRGEAFVCTLTGSPIERSYIQQEGKSGRIGKRLIAIVAEGKRSRQYLSATPEHDQIPLTDTDMRKVDDFRAGFLAGNTPTRAEITGGVCSAYGLSTWGHLFNDRQVIALTTLSSLVNEVRNKVISDSKLLDWDIGGRLDEQGTGSAAYGEAVATNLAFSIDKLADLGNTLVRWEPVAQCPRQLFGRQGMAMIWDYAEGNILSDSSGGLKVIVEGQSKSLSSALGWHSRGVIGNISQLDAAKNNYPVRPVVISTDPPYYDNIGYAVLSDFFYCWLKKSLRSIWPNLFRRIATPKEVELVANSLRHGGQDAAEEFFMSGMRDAMRAMRSASVDDCPQTIFYAFKQSETGKEGVTSAGWASFLQAIHDSGLTVDGTWPVRTENASRMVSQGSNALASSIVLVCRKRPSDASIITRGDFIRMLKNELPDAIDDIRKAGVGPVDMQQSVIGPGMGVFSRHAKVLEDDDCAMTVKTALAIINRIWGEIENEADSSLDSETQVALAWFASYGFDVRASGELIMLANAKNVGSDALYKSEVFQDLRGKTQLTPREVLPKDWSPMTDKTLTVWECVQHAARILNAEDGGEAAAARLIGEMGSKADDARALAYRLFQIATDKGWAQEALVYNELAAEWPRLEALSGELAAAAPIKPTQTTLDL
jgi:putative DNA methylase